MILLAGLYTRPGACYDDGMDAFEAWWDTLGEEAETWPKRALAAAAHGGEIAERARIRQLALDRSSRLENAGELLPAATLRDFAALLEDR